MVAIAVLMLASLSLSIYASGFVGSPVPSTAPGKGSFTSSPSANRKPDVQGGGSDAGEDCTMNDPEHGKDAVIVVPYSERATLPDGGAEMEAAYWTIANNTDLGELGEVFKKLANLSNVDSKILSITDLFEIHHDGCDAEHSTYTIRIKPQNPKIYDNFVSVVYYDGEEWVRVNSSVDEDGVITIVTDKLGVPFAIVVHDGSGISLQTAAYIAAGLAAAAGVLSICLICLIFKKKKLD